MDQLIGVGLQHFVPVILTLGCAAKDAFPVFPAVGNALVADIPLCIAKMRHRIDAVRVFAAIDAPAREQAGQFGDGNTVKLVMKDVVNTLLQVGKDRLQSGQQPLGDLPQEHAAFAGRVYKNAVFDTNRKSLLRHIRLKKA